MLSRRSIAVVAVLALLTASVFAKDRPPAFAADTATIDNALSGADRVAPQFSAKLARLREQSQPLFVIVPGILGSILHNGDPAKPFWGEKGLFSGFHRDDLEYRDIPAQVAFMDNFAFVGERDVYGRLRDHLRFYSFGKQRPQLEFPYDWRQDIRQSAADFDGFLKAHRADIDGRDVVIIAHSMGGLVVRWWYYTRYTDPAHTADYAFLRTPQVLFVGTPHYGSPSALVALAGRYGSGDKLEPIINYFMKDLDDVAASFYSAYQLLPFGASSIIFRGRDGQEHNNVDLFAPAIWETCQWGTRLRERKHISKREFYDSYLPPRLKAAREFATAMVALGEDPTRNPSAVCFYSDDTTTPATIRVVQRNDSCTPAALRTEGGDGRVLAEYTPFAASPHAHGAVRHLTRPHMQLPKDQAFLQYIDDMRDAALARAILAAEPTTAVFGAFRNAGSLLPIPLGLAQIKDGGTQAVVAFDRAVLNVGRQRPQSDADLSKLLYEWGRSAPDYSQTALRLYALAIAFDPDGTWAAYAGNHLGDILVNADRWDEALPYLEHTNQHLRALDQRERLLLERFHNTIGVAYERTGKYERALEHYALAKTKEATRNRTNLCGSLADHHVDVATGLCGNNSARSADVATSVAVARKRGGRPQE